MIFKVLFLAFTGIGVFLILSDVFKVPYMTTSKAVMSIANKTKKASAKDVFIHDITDWLARFIKINTYKRESMLQKLKTADILLTPEQFIAKALIKPIILGIVSICLLWIFPIASIVTITLSLLYYFREFEQIEINLKKKRKAIESELNRFVSQISKYVNHNKNVLSILEMYLKYAGPAFAAELKITIADMRSGNQETALTRLESRVNSTGLSDIVRGLICIIQGNSTSAYWETLGIKFSEMSRQELKKEANKIPAKVNRCTMAIVFCFIGMMIVMLGTNLLDSANIFKM